MTQHAPASPIIVGDKRRLLRYGIFFTLLAFATALFLVTRIGAFPPLMVLIALISLGLVVFLYRLRNAAHVLRIDEEGIDDRTQGFGGGRMLWNEIESCQVVEADSRKMIGLTLSEEARAQRDLFSRTIMDEQRGRLGCDVVLPPEVFGEEDPVQYADALSRYIADPEARRRLSVGA